MTEDQLIQINNWFEGFVGLFKAPSPEEQRNYDLKIDHTARVRANMERLTTSLALAPEERNLAEAIATCHDVGRFPQYRCYATFNDATSANHAALAVQTLNSERVLESLDEEESDTILQAVALHNVFTLSGSLAPKLSLYAQLIRDADKLDIWKVLIEYCLLPPEERASAVIWELPDTGECSTSAIDEVIAGRMINRSLLATADDFKLLQLSWAFDLNFDESFRILAERGYIETLADLLPHQSGCLEALATVRNFLQSRGRQLS